MSNIILRGTCDKSNKLHFKIVSGNVSRSNINRLTKSGNVLIHGSHRKWLSSNSQNNNSVKSHKFHNSFFSAILPTYTQIWAVMTMAYLAYQLGSLLIQMCHNVQVILCALQQIRKCLWKQKTTSCPIKNVCYLILYNLKTTWTNNHSFWHVISWMLNVLASL